VKLSYKIILILMLLVPLGLLVPVVSHFSDQTFYIFPSILEADIRYIESFTDSIWNGASSIEEFSYDSEKLLIKYILRKSEHKYPNVFIIFWLDIKKPFVDLSGYDYITIRLKEATLQEVTLFIKTFEEGFSKPGRQHADTLRHNENVISFLPTQQEYTIHISDFDTQPWWYAKMNTSGEEIGKETYRKVVSFDLHCIHLHNDPPDEGIQSFIIEEIAFRKKTGIMVHGVVGTFVLYYAAYAAVFLLLKQKEKKSLLQYRHVTVTHDRDADVHRVKAYVEQHYNNPDISTTNMQEELGIPSFLIYNLIKQEYGQSFKQLINTIRIEEAKRLLRESDLRVIDISYKVGFNDTSYFNKIFRQREGMSPTEYRGKKHT
jgi:AraC-like DNA-binding protein